METELAVVPQCSPLASYLERRDEIDAAVFAALRSGTYILGPEVRAFEGEFADFIGAKHAIGVANGTDALVVALKALGVGHGDVVVTVSHTAVATISAIVQSGARPLLVDTDPFHGLDVDALRRVLDADLERAIRAIVVVHLFGQTAALPELLEAARRHGAFMIEDCAQAHGARLHDQTAGTWGDIAAFSFYPTKNLHALGDGGAVVTNDRTLAQASRELAQYGWVDRVAHRARGQNSRLDEVQAAILRVNLRWLDRDNDRRIAIARTYDRALAGNSQVFAPKVRAGARHVFHQYVVTSAWRDQLRSALDAARVGTSIHYPRPVHAQPAHAGLVTSDTDLTHTTTVSHQILSLPMFPQLTASEIGRVADALRVFECRAR